MNKTYLITYYEGEWIQETKKGFTRSPKRLIKSRVFTRSPKRLIKSILHSTSFTLLKVVEIDPDKHFNLTIYSHELNCGHYSTPAFNSLLK